jgi:hypothetical protein
VTRATARAGPRSRSARGYRPLAGDISATIMQMREPGRSTQARARIGVTGIAPRMSRLSLPIRWPDPADSSSISFVSSANGGEPC